MTASPTEDTYANPLAGPCAGAPCADLGPGGALPAGVGRLALVLGVLFGLASTASSATAVVLPRLAADLGVGVDSAVWVISGYVLMLAVATAAYGRAADLVGLRRPLVVGLTLMAVGAVLSAAAPNFPLLLAARLLQGLGAASVPVLGTALVSALYAGQVRAVALARVAGAAAAISALGPLLGGVLATVGGWRLAVLLPAAGVLLAGPVVRAAPTGGSGGRLDLRGALLTSAAASGLILLLQSPSTGLAVGVVGGVLLAAGVPLSVRHLRARPDGFLPRAVVGSPTVVRSSLAAASVPFAWFALLVAVPTLLVAHGWSVLHVGLALVPSAATGLLASRASGRLLAAIGPTRALAVAAAGAVGSLLTGALGAATFTPPLLVAAVMLVAVAFGLGQPALVAAVGAAVDPAVRGVALGIATLVFLTGGALGSAAVGGLTGALGTGGTLLLLALPPVVAAVGVLGVGRPTARARPAVPGRVSAAPAPPGA